ncbi:hypothetical protein GO988_07620 [Hymenobacter sp. HMF4947]|uniref:Uncharacterized protein n=1 Tax=Hymenobacter ginkgonis TaxID=2682976 RepID=A0A7K1TCS3_9BACT|nr:hypothetical protein [Hymenobacter ginkgonis]MVN76190.1 hypothetical protein [Hymenobacter ginkgonis]
MLSRGNQHDVQIDSVLAEVLVEGPFMLWRVARPRVTHFLLRRPGQPVLELSERRYLRQMPSGGWAITEGNDYHAQLGQYVGDCPAAYQAAATAAFTAAGMVGVVRAYDETCAPGQAPFRSWLAQATPRRKQAFQAGIVAGTRYNRIENFAYSTNGACADCGVHPFGGLYAELVQPSRTTAIYGELSLSPFHSSSAQFLGIDNSGNVFYSYFDYRAWLATARLGVRYFAPLAHDQALVFSIGYEFNRVLSPTITSTNGLPVIPDTESMGYATPTLLPNFGLGWRWQRLTLLLDGQLYSNSNSRGRTDARFVDFFFGSNFAARLGVGYRLGHTSDNHTAKSKSGIE